MKSVALLFLVCSCENYCPLPVSKVVSIGGCDRDGECGVMLENGYHSQVYKPAIGQQIVKRVMCRDILK